MKSKRFYAVYLLTSLQPEKYMKISYIGFTVSPKRRIRQHNGYLVSGAKRTRKYRPWEMVMIISGFPTKFHALQFEYAWQHPYTYKYTKGSLNLIKNNRDIGQIHSIKRRMNELSKLVLLDPWKNLTLTLHFTKKEYMVYGENSKYFNDIPSHFTIKIETVEELAKYKHQNHRKTDYLYFDDKNDVKLCTLCEKELVMNYPYFTCYYKDCPLICHLFCLESKFLSNNIHYNNQNNKRLQGTCPICLGKICWEKCEKDVTTKDSINKKSTGFRKKNKSQNKTFDWKNDPFSFDSDSDTEIIKEYKKITEPLKESMRTYNKENEIIMIKNRPETDMKKFNSINNCLIDVNHVITCYGTSMTTQEKITTNVGSISDKRSCHEIIDLTM